MGRVQGCEGQGRGRCVGEIRVQGCRSGEEVCVGGCDVVQRGDGVLLKGGMGFLLKGVCSKGGWGFAHVLSPALCTLPPHPPPTRPV